MGALLLVLSALLLISTPARAGMREDLIRCEGQVLPKFRGWSPSHPSGPASPSSAEDLYCLGLAHWAGRYEYQRDLPKAAGYLLRAAEQNHAGAQGLLGFLYSKGLGVNQDPALAVAWWRRSAAQGNADSLNALAVAYENGQGVPQDRAEAMKLYRQAAERGSKEAQSRLAAQQPQPARAGQKQFDEGLPLYKARNYTAAARLFLQAAEMGHPRAQLQIGYQYEHGEGVPKNDAEAVKWYHKAAEQGDATAQSNLGSMYEEGTGTPENWAEAVKWYQRSAQQGHASGQFRLGRMYQFGTGVAQNRAQAVALFEKASVQGHSQATFFARSLRNPTNFIGFRSEQEEAYVIANRLRTALLFKEPVGMLFRNSGERWAYIKSLRASVDREEAYSRWSTRKREYDDCRQANRSGCMDPGPAP